MCRDRVISDVSAVVRTGSLPPVGAQGVAHRRVARAVSCLREQPSRRRGLRCALYGHALTLLDSLLRGVIRRSTIVRWALT